MKINLCQGAARKLVIAIEDGVIWRFKPEDWAAYLYAHAQGSDCGCGDYAEQLGEIDHDITDLRQHQAVAILRRLKVEEAGKTACHDCGAAVCAFCEECHAGCFLSTEECAKARRVKGLAPAQRFHLKKKVVTK